MKWIVQKNIHNRSFEGLLSYLDHNEKEVYTVSYTNDDSHGKNLTSITDIIEGQDRNHIGLFGSVRLIHDVRDTFSKDLCPTIIALNDQYYYMNYWFGDDYLNIKSQYGNSSNIEIYLDAYGKIFVKPILDKSFSGVVLDKERMSDSDMEFYDFLKSHNYQIIYNHDLKKLKREYRFWVVENKIVTGSQYMLDGLVEPSKVIPEPVFQYANMVKSKCGLLAYTLDIAEIEEHNSTYFKVIEINCVNSSGLYDADEKSLVESLKSIDTINVLPLNFGIVEFTDAPVNSEDSKEYKEWEASSPFNESYLQWFQDRNYDPVIQLYDDNVGFYRIPLSQVTNKIISSCNEENDSILIEDKTIEILHKLTWI